MYMTLYHHTAPRNIKPILESGALIPNSYSDVDPTGMNYWQWKEGQPPPFRGWTPRVLYLTTAERETDMITYLRRNEPWPLARTWRFTVRVPVYLVQSWDDFAKQHGADPEWLEWCSQFRGDEYVSTVKVPSSQWLEVRHMPTSHILQREVVAGSKDDCAQCRSGRTTGENARTAHGQHQR